MTFLFYYEYIYFNFIIKMELEILIFNEDDRIILKQNNKALENILSKHFNNLSRELFNKENYKRQNYELYQKKVGKT